MASATCVVENRMPWRPPAAAMQDSAPGVNSRARHRGPCQDFSLGDPLSDMSQFGTELCKYCADIAPTVPSLRGVP